MTPLEATATHPVNAGEGDTPSPTPLTDPNSFTGGAGAGPVAPDVFDLVILNSVPLPLMPLYDLNTAAALVPMAPMGIRGHLQRNKHLYPPPVYRRCPGGRKVRLVTAYEIREIRKRVLVGPGVDRTLQLYPNPKAPR